MIKAATKEFKSLALTDRPKWLIPVESFYSKIVKLLNKDSFPLPPNLCFWNFAQRVLEGSRTSVAVKEQKVTLGARSHPTIIPR